MLTDIRYAVRSLAKSPGFSLVAIATLAIGIGAVAALFTIVHGVLMKPLDYPDADRIVAVVNQFKDRTGPALAGGDETDIAADTTAFDAVAYYHGGEMGVQLGDRAEFVGIRLVHPDFFRVFTVTPVAGRPFNADDAMRSAVVSAGFAARNYGTAAHALTRHIFIENRSYEIVGVMPERMRFPADTDVWAASALTPDNPNRTAHNFRVVARLAPGMSLAGANARLAALSQRLAHDFPVSNSDTTFATVPLGEFLTGPVRTTLFMLFGAAALVLLIACANVANLMLARGAIRAREVAVRTALGASRRQILGLCLVESLVLAAVACGIGLALASVGTAALLRVGARAIALPRVSDVSLDWRVSLFAAGMSLVTVLVCGFAPAIQAARVSLRDALNHGTRSATSGPSSRLRAGLMIAQIALSYALAIDAGLLVRSFVAMTETSLGFRSEGVLVMYAHAPAHPTESETTGLPAYLRVGRFFDDVLGRLRQQPDVVSAGGAMGLPTGQYSSNGSYAVEGVSSFDGDTRRLPTAGFRLASPGYFETLEIPVLRGRAFNDGDVFERPAVAIVSESLARATFGHDDPIGHRIQCGFDRPNVWMTVVGVVSDVRQASPASLPGPELYMPLRQHPFMANEVQIVVRGRGTPESLIPLARQLVRTANPDVAMKFVTLDTSVRTSIAAPRFRATLVGTFAILALLLAAAGTYSVMSYMTARRTAEFGVRMALGARANDLARLVLSDAIRLAVAGSAIGLALALITSRIVASMLFGVTSNDVSTHVLVMLTALPAVLAAAAIPALRAARTNPIDALKA